MAVKPKVVSATHNGYRFHIENIAGPGDLQSAHVYTPVWEAADMEAFIKYATAFKPAQKTGPDAEKVEGIAT